jgi:hypothetical protein
MVGRRQEGMGAAPSTASRNDAVAASGLRYRPGSVASINGA